MRIAGGTDELVCRCPSAGRDHSMASRTNEFVCATRPRNNALERVPNSNFESVLVYDDPA